MTKSENRNNYGEFLQKKKNFIKDNERQQNTSSNNNEWILLLKWKPPNIQINIINKFHIKKKNFKN